VTSASTPVQVLGSVNVDLMVFAARAPVAGELVFGHDFSMQLGGKGTNVAAQVARSGAPVTFHACVGDDELGTFARAQLGELGLALDRLVVLPVHTGVGHVHVDDDGEYRSIVVPGANASSPLLGAALTDALADAPAVVLQFEAGGEARQQVLAGPVGGARRYLNPSPWMPVAAAEIRGTDALVCNLVEARACADLLGLDGSALDAPTLALQLAEAVAEVVVTRGAAGAVAATSGTLVEHPGFEVEPVGAIGAGDAFLGEYVVARVGGADLATALAQACAAGALATLDAGPNASRATRDAIDRLVSDRG
jgi:ribokinase